MDFGEWWTVNHQGFTNNETGKFDIAREAYLAGVKEGFRRAAEKEARKRSTGLVHNEELKPRDSED
jgi:hypothetical protein